MVPTLKKDASQTFPDAADQEAPCWLDSELKELEEAAGKQDSSAALLVATGDPDTDKELKNFRQSLLLFFPCQQSVKALRSDGLNNMNGDTDS